MRTAWYSRFAKSAAHFCGRPRVFALAAAAIAVWMITGPIFGFSDTWDELIRATHGAHNALLDLEELEEGSLDEFRARYQGLAVDARAQLQRGRRDTGTPEP